MQLKRLELRNYRCFEQVTIGLCAYNCFVGQNNAGKSTLLKALDRFFESTPRLIRITADDFHAADQELMIGITFTDLSTEAFEEFKHYYRAGELTFYIKAALEDGQVSSRMFGMRSVMQEFVPFFEATTAKEKKPIYEELLKKYDFPRWVSKDSAEAILRSYEDKHPEFCEPIESGDDAFGAVGPVSRIRRYVEWIYVPAVKDAAAEQIEAKSSAFGKLVQRVVRSQVNFGERINTIRSDAQIQLAALVDEHRSTLDDLASQIDADFKSITSLAVDVKLDWSPQDLNSITVREPIVRSLLDDGGYRGEVSSFGHGLQRNYLIALLRLNAKLSYETTPKLIFGCEEPELYQHPPQVRYLQRVLRELSGSNQVMITTHSPHFVSPRDFGSTNILRKKNGKSRICTHSVADQVQLIATAKGEHPIGEPTVLAALCQFLQTDVSEIFFCERIILVEGTEDHAIIEVFLEKKGLRERYLKAGGHIVAVGGKGNLINAIALARGFDLPYIAVFDGDTDCSEKQAKANRVLNRNIFSIAEHPQEDPWPYANLFLPNVVVWPTNIQGSMSDCWPSWNAECASWAERFGWPKKSPSLIEAALVSALEQGAHFECLERLAANVVTFFESARA